MFSLELVFFCDPQCGENVSDNFDIFTSALCKITESKL